MESRSRNARRPPVESAIRTLICFHKAGKPYRIPKCHRDLARGSRAGVLECGWCSALFITRQSGQIKSRINWRP
jgi:hypothetical protein